MDNPSIAFKERVIPIPRRESCQEENTQHFQLPIRSREGRGRICSTERSRDLVGQRQRAAGVLCLSQSRNPAPGQSFAHDSLRFQLQLPQMTEANPVRQRTHACAPLLRLAPGAHRNGKRKFNLVRSHCRTLVIAVLTAGVNRSPCRFRQPRKLFVARERDRAFVIRSPTATLMAGMNAKKTPVTDAREGAGGEPAEKRCHRTIRITPH
jgi:hypothetical protein